MAEIKDPIVSMVEFKGRLWLATSKGVFVKRDDEDVFDAVEIIPASITPAENSPFMGPLW